MQNAYLSSQRHESRIQIVQKKNFVPLRLCASVPSFTLIELLVVMVVVSILVGVTIQISRYVNYRARIANRQIYVEKIKSALEDYRAAYGEYPITPGTNSNYDDVLRHYPANYATRCFYTTNSPSTNVVLVTNTVETIQTEGGNCYIDYALTYPLMLKQLESGARPFMDFKEVTVAFLIYHPKEDATDTYEVARKRKTKGGSTRLVWVKGIYGNAVNRYKAIDPVSQKQWKYTSLDGVTYILATNSF